MTTMTISAQVEEYLASRRAMGFELRGEGYQLRAFARFANQQGEAGTLTMEMLLRWVQGAATPGPVTAARRVEVLRPFLKYCRQFDPVCPVVPSGFVAEAIGGCLRTFTQKRKWSLYSPPPVI